jgi:hypothetical protein
MWSTIDFIMHSQAGSRVSLGECVIVPNLRRTYIASMPAAGVVPMMSIRLSLCRIVSRHLARSSI